MIITRTPDCILPEKLSALLRLALSDLKKVEAQPEVYRVDMQRWHIPLLAIGPGAVRCTVCLAGAVLAKTCQLKPRDVYNPTLGGETGPIPLLDRQLYAIDRLRRGDVTGALRWMRDREKEDRHFFSLNRRTPGYYGKSFPEENAQFYIELEKLADDLEKVGL